DAQLVRFLKSIRRDFLVVATKADKLSGNGRAKARSALIKGLEVNDLLLCSARSGVGLKDLWSAIHASADSATGAKVISL
ncbi:MAG: ribosome biogenesis GTP-binding protein YsxC, partial [Acidobacteriaceae bacterium]|nr:ribosome biogenesis GTP-binding protein YsxC [Acidobacteriaceae bacterium]